MTNNCSQVVIQNSTMA